MCHKNRFFFIVNSVELSHKQNNNAHPYSFELMINVHPFLGVYIGERMIDITNVIKK